MRFFKRLMVVGALAGAAAAGTASTAAADVPCGLSSVYINGENRWGWNMRNCNAHGVNWKIQYVGGVIGSCYYVGPGEIRVGSSVHQPSFLIGC